MTRQKSNILEKSKILEITSTLSLLYGLALENNFWLTISDINFV